MWTLSDPGQPGGPAGGVAPAQALAPAGRTEGGAGPDLIYMRGSARPGLQEHVLYTEYINLFLYWG